MAILGIVLLLVLLGVMTMAEMATFSARKERMVQAVDAGDRRGTLVLAYQRSPASYLGPVQLIATAASLVLGALSAEYVQVPITAWLDQFELTTGWKNGLGFALALTLMTVISLVFSNVLPKQVGFVKANEIALAFAPVTRLLIKVARPLAWLVSVATNILYRVFKITPAERLRVTERDIVSLIAEGSRSGGLDGVEAEIVHRTLKLSDICVTSEMSPIDECDWVDPAWGAQRIDAEVRNSDRSLLVVASQRPANVLGVIRARDWLALAKPEAADLRRLMSPPAYADADDSVVDVLQTLRPLATRLVFVRDPSGNVIGLISLNDAVRLVLGPIADL